jgi:hypothetical protein
LWDAGLLHHLGFTVSSLAGSYSVFLLAKSTEHEEDGITNLDANFPGKFSDALHVFLVGYYVLPRMAKI